MGFLSPEVTWTICSVRFLEEKIISFRKPAGWNFRTEKYPGCARLQAAARRALTNMSDGTRSATLWGETCEVLKQPAPTPAINPVAPELPSIQPGNGSFQVPMTKAQDNLIIDIQQGASKHTNWWSDNSQFDVFPAIVQKVLCQLLRESVGIWMLSDQP